MLTKQLTTSRTVNFVFFSLLLIVEIQVLFNFKIILLEKKLKSWLREFYNQRDQQSKETSKRKEPDSNDEAASMSEESYLISLEQIASESLKQTYEQPDSNEPPSKIKKLNFSRRSTSRNFNSIFTNGDDITTSKLVGDLISLKNSIVDSPSPPSLSTLSQQVAASNRKASAAITSSAAVAAVSLLSLSSSPGSNEKQLQSQQQQSASSNLSYDLETIDKLFANYTPTNYLPQSKN